MAAPRSCRPSSRSLSHNESLATVQASATPACAGGILKLGSAHRRQELRAEMERHATEKEAIAQREAAADAKWQQRGQQAPPATVQRPWAIAALSLPEHAAVRRPPIL